MVAIVVMFAAFLGIGMFARDFNVKARLLMLLIVAGVIFCITFL